VRAGRSASIEAKRRPLRVLLVKAGLDAHERGMHVVSRGLRDEGFEVIVLGLRQSAGAVAQVAVQEDVDVVGISSLAGGHLAYVRAVRRALDELGGDPVVVVGGVIPQEDRGRLTELGVAEIYPPGSSVRAMARRLEELCGLSPATSIERGTDG
jgi:methylmalonyl-CoA mutase C-terminal domain/subunit